MKDSREGIPAYMLTAEDSAGAGIGKERPLSAGDTHYLGKAGFLPLQNGKTFGVHTALLKSLPDKSALLVTADGAYSVNRHMGVYLLQIQCHIGHTTAHRRMDAVNLCQLPAGRESGDFIDFIHNHRTGHGDAGVLDVIHFSCTPLPEGLPAPSGRTACLPGWECRWR